MKSVSYTLNDLFILYLAFTENVNSTHTTKTNISTYNKHIRDNFGTRTIESITTLEYQNLFNKLLNDGFKPKTVKNIKALLHTIYNKGIQNRYTDFNPISYTQLPSFDNARNFHYSVEVQKEIIRAIIDHKEKPYNDIFFFLLQGRRLGEILNLTWDNVNLDDRIYHIPPKINKAKRKMSYKMTDDLFDRLFDIYDVSSLKNLNVEDGYIFVNEQTNNKYVDISKAWKRLLKNYNLPKIRIHDIRHLIGTYTINYLGLPIEHVSHTLGHTDIAITQKYITKIPDTAKEVLDEVIKSVK